MCTPLFVGGHSMISHFISAWRSGLRGHSFQTVFALGILLIGGAYLAATFSPRQPETVALDVGFSGIHFSLVLLSLFWVQDLVGKEIDRRTTILYLAYPIPRFNYVLGRFSGICMLLFLASIILGLLLWVAVMSSSEMYAQAHRGNLGWPFWLAILGIWLNAIVVAAFTLCVAALSTTPALPLALGAAFSIAGQSIGTVANYLASGAGGQTELVTKYAGIINMAQWVLPDLSHLDWRIWSMYNIPVSLEHMALSVLMATTYVGLMLIISVKTFNNREFD